MIHANIKRYMEILLKIIFNSDKSIYLNEAQKKFSSVIKKIKNSLLLISPCGSGKSEIAYFFCSIYVKS